MRTKRTLTAALVSLCLIGGSKAAAAGGAKTEVESQQKIENGISDVKSIEKMCATLSMMREKGDSRLFTRLLTAAIPQLNTVQGRAALEQTYTLASAYATPDKEVVRQLIEILLQIGGIDNATMAEITEIINKVYPLYVYQMQNRVRPEMDDAGDYTIDTLYQAPVDEEYFGIGDIKNHYEPYGLSDEQMLLTKQMGGKLKRNGSYAWGMGSYGGKLFWSTNNNYLCMDGYGSFVQPGEAGSAYENKCWVCEFEQGIYGRQMYKNDPDKQKYSDIRPPRIYSYDPRRGVVIDITPSGPGFEVLKNCQGLRSMGALDGVVFFGGPGLYGSDWDSRVSAAFVAYDADAERFISASDMGNVDGCQVVNVRRWREYNGVLYVSVGILHPVTGKKMGAVLRWYGDKTDPWNFHIVGLQDDEAAEIAVFNNRIYVGTWGSLSGSLSRVYVGPEIPADGMQPVSINSEMWQPVWSTAVAEPSPTSGRAITAIAGFHEWRGHLYWGVFCPDYYMLAEAQAIYGTLTSPDALAFILGNYRTPSFWRLDKDNVCEMLYGETENPKPVYAADGKTIESWVFESNGLKPKWGRGGFGNFWTIYIWALNEYNGNLYIGTMDLGNLADAVGSSSFPADTFSSLASMLGLDKNEYGFELLRMTDEETAPKLVTTNGFNNSESYGLRNLEPFNDNLIIGTASNSNLVPHGGWHVHTLREKDIITGVEPAEMVKPGIIMQRNDSYINFATVDGSAIREIRVYDASGRIITSAKPMLHIASLPLAGVRGIAIIKVTGANGEWEVKLAE